MSDAVDDIARQRIDTHEEICSLRYQGIADGMTDIKHALSEQAKDLKGMRMSMNKTTTSALIAVITMLIGLVAYFYNEKENSINRRIAEPPAHYQQYAPRKN